jgi:hypothetical protein
MASENDYFSNISMFDDIDTIKNDLNTVKNISNQNVFRNIFKDTNVSTNDFEQTIEMTVGFEQNVNKTTMTKKRKLLERKAKLARERRINKKRRIHTIDAKVKYLEEELVKTQLYLHNIVEQNLLLTTLYLTKGSFEL